MQVKIINENGTNYYKVVERNTKDGTFLPRLTLGEQEIVDLIKEIGYSNLDLFKQSKNLNSEGEDSGGDTTTSEASGQENYSQVDNIKLTYQDEQKDKDDDDITIKSDGLFTIDFNIIKSRIKRYALITVMLIMFGLGFYVNSLFNNQEAQAKFEKDGNFEWYQQIKAIDFKIVDLNIEKEQIKNNIIRNLLNTAMREAVVLNDFDNPEAKKRAIELYKKEQETQTKK